MKLPKRSKEFGVGKYIGGCTYVHKSCQKVFVDKGIKGFIKELNGFKYDVIKYNHKQGSFSFIQCSDFNSAHEPSLGKVLLVKFNDGEYSTKLMNELKDPWIYHHKWLFVFDNYKGFNVEESVSRSEEWMSIENIQYNRIGKHSFWKSFLEDNKMKV